MMRRSPKLCRPAAILLLVVASALATACGGEESDALQVDSALGRDLTLATADTSLLELRDAAPLVPPPTRAPVARATTGTRTPTPKPAPPPTPRPAPASDPVPAPITPAPIPEPAPAPAPRAMIASGTAMSLTVGSQVCTTNKPGDKFIATLSEPVYGSNGASLPAGTRAVLEVASVTPGANGTDAAITFRVRTLETGTGAVAPSGVATPIDSLQKVRLEGGTSDAKKVAAGAIAGAILGQVIGKDTKGTVIGAAAGAAAGTAAARMGAKYQGCLPSGGRVRLVLAEGLVVG
jgi:hypothetical protein